MKYGYARVSTNHQNAVMQLTALKKAGCKTIFKDELWSNYKVDGILEGSHFMTTIPYSELSLIDSSETGVLRKKKRARLAPLPGEPGLFFGTGSKLEEKLETHLNRAGTVALAGNRTKCAGFDVGIW